jgi:hypothetical protein
MVMRFLSASLLAAIVCSGAAHATTYNLNLLSPFLPIELYLDGLSPGPQATVSTLACSATTCAGGRQTAYSFYANPGDVLHFGTLALGTFSFGDGRQQQAYHYVDANGQPQIAFGTPTALYQGVYGVTDHYISTLSLPPNFPLAVCNSADPTCFSRLALRAAATPPLEVDLTFTVGSSGFIEVGWVGGTYTPPAYIGAVPEPTTWAMLLIGFAGIGFAAYRQRHRTLRTARSLQ